VKRIGRSKPPARDDDANVSRREFARRATLAAAAIAANPTSVFGVSVAHGAAPAPARQEPAGDKPKLSAEALAEAEARSAEILRRYGAKLSDEQKADIRRLAREAQVQLEALRAFPLENSDEPAMVLHLVQAPASARHSGASPGTAAAPGAASGGKKPAGRGA